MTIFKTRIFKTNVWFLMSHFSKRISTHVSRLISIPLNTYMSQYFIHIYSSHIYILILPEMFVIYILSLNYDLFNNLCTFSFNFLKCNRDLFKLMYSVNTLVNFHYNLTTGIKIGIWRYLWIDSWRSYTCDYQRVCSSPIVQINVLKF